MNGKDPYRDEKGRSQTWAARRPTSRKKTTVLNWRVLVWTIVGLLAGGGGAWLWHTLQVKDFAGEAMVQGRQVEAKADELATKARGLLVEAQKLDAQAPGAEAQKLIQQAHRCLKEASEGRVAAMEYFLRYMELEPEDPEAPLALARLSQENGNLPAAVEWYEAALRAADGGGLSSTWPETGRVHAQLAELLFTLGQAYHREVVRTGKSEYRDSAIARFRQAQTEARAVLNQDEVEPDHESQARRVLALASFALHELAALEGDDEKSEPVGDALEEALQQDPSNSALALSLARVYREFPDLLSPQIGEGGQPQEISNAAADRVMQQLVDAAEQNLKDAKDPDEAKITAAVAHVSRCRYLASYNLSDAASDLDRALELAPDSPDVRIWAGQLLMQEAASLASSEPENNRDRKEKLEQACEHFLTARHAEFGNRIVYLGLGEAYRSLGRIDDAIQNYRLGLQNVDGNDLDLNFALAEILIDNERLTTEEAEKLFKSLHDGLASQRPYLSESVRRTLEARASLLRARWQAQTKDYGPAAGLLEAILAERSLATSRQQDEKVVNEDEVRAKLLLFHCYEALGRQKLAEAVQGGSAATDPTTDQSPEKSPAAEAARREAESLFVKAGEICDQLVRDLPHVGQFQEWGGRMYLAAGQPDVAVLHLQRAVERDDSISLRLLLAHARLEQAKQGNFSRRLLDVVENDLNVLERRIQQEPVDRPWAIQLMRAELLARKAVGDDSEEGRDQAIPILRDLEEKYPLSAELRTSLIAKYRELDASEDIARAGACREIITLLSENRASDALVPEEKLKQLAGDNGVLWRFYRANRLLMETSSGFGARKDRIEETRQLVAGLLEDRPEWAPAHLLDANLKRTEGNVVDAVNALEMASKLEPTNLRTLDQLIRLQLQLGQVEEAENRLAEARAEVTAPDAFRLLETLVKRSAGDHQAAIQLAREEVGRQPANADAQLRLAALLQEAGKTDEAETVVREALAVNADDPRLMTLLFTLYDRAEKTEEAEAVLQQLAASKQLEPTQREVLLARGYETLDQAEKAETHFNNAEEAYRENLKKSPEDLQLHLQLVELLLRDEDPARLGRAEEEIHKILATAPDSPDAKRLQARVLWLRNQGEDRQEALAIFDQLASDPQQGSEADLYRRAQMLEMMGQFDTAGTAFDDILETRALTAQALAAQIGRYLRTGQLENAESALSRLEKMAPGDVETVSLKIRLLHQANRDSEIEPVVTWLQQRLEPRAAANPLQKARVSMILGQLYSSANMHAKAEPYYEAAVSSEPAALGHLAACVAAQGRVEEAVEMVLAAGHEVDEATKAIALCRIFLSARVGDEQWKAAEPVLKAAAEAYAQRIDLLVGIANVYAARDQIGQAIALLEKAIAVDPNNVIVLNNLASLLGEQPGRSKDALQYIDRAIHLSSQAANLLDTKGTILLHLERPDEALAILDRAVTGSTQDPRFMLHLAVACDQTGDVARAREMLQRALDDGLLQRPDLILAPLDKAWLEELRKKNEL